MSSRIPLDTPTAEPEPIQPPRRRVGRDALTTLAFRSGGLPFTFAITIVTSRFLLPTGRGAFVLALLTVTLASTLLGNVGVAAQHELSRKEHDERVVVGQALSITLVLGIVAAVTLYPIDLALADQAFHRVAFVAVGLPAVLVVQTLSAALVGVGRLPFSNFLQFLLPIVTLAAMFGFVIGLHRGTTGAVAAWVVAQLVVAAVALAGSHRLWWPLRLRGLPRERIESMGLLGLRIGFVNLVSLLNYRIELIILELYHGLAQVGLYSLAVSLAELLWVVSGSFTTATVAPLVAAETDDAAAALIARSARAALAATAVLGVAIGVGGWFLISPVFGTYFESSTRPLLILIPGAVAFAPAAVIASFFSLRQGKTRYPLRFSLLSVCVTAVLAVVLIPGHFGVGAALASTAGYSVSMAGAAVWFSRKGHVPLRDLVPSVADYRSYASLLSRLVRR